MPFDSPITVAAAPSGTLWYLLHDVIYQGQVDSWTVPAGTLTDFASVPIFLTWFAPRQGLYTPAVVLHDWFCEVGIRTAQISPRDADGVLRRVLRELGVPRLQRWLMWAGVRWGAAVQAHRRPDWWRDAPAVLALSVAALPLILPASLAVLAQLGFNKLVGLAVGQ